MGAAFTTMHQGTVLVDHWIHIDEDGYVIYYRHEDEGTCAYNLGRIY